MAISNTDLRHIVQSTFLRSTIKNPGCKICCRGVSDIAVKSIILGPPVESGFQCASCGEWNVTSVDESAGRRQSYVEDCQICCKPNVLRIEYDNSLGEFFITSELE